MQYADDIKGNVDCSCTNSENLCVKTIIFFEVPNYENGDNNTFDSLQFS